MLQRGKLVFGWRDGTGEWIDPDMWPGGEVALLHTVTELGATVRRAVITRPSPKESRILINYAKRHIGVYRKPDQGGSPEILGTPTPQAQPASMRGPGTAIVPAGSIHPSIHPSVQGRQAAPFIDTPSNEAGPAHAGLEGFVRHMESGTTVAAQCRRAASTPEPARACPPWTLSSDTATARPWSPQR